MLTKIQKHLFLILCLGVVALASCTPRFFPPPEAMIDEQWLTHESKVRAIEDWRLRGKMSLRYRDERVNYHLVWECRRGGNINFSLYTPLRQKVMEFFYEDGKAWLRDGLGKVHRADTAQDLMNEVLGIEMPLLNICDWGKGIPNTDTKITRMVLSPEKRLQELTQSQWQIRYLRYMQLADTQLPAKIDLRKNGVQLVLLVKHWETSL